MLLRRVSMLVVADCLWRRRGFVRFRWLLVVAACVSTAQAQYRFDHWTADTGLPQNSVYQTLQTRDGYLWLATVDGLARFDGVRFTVFNKSNSPGISNNRFICLYEDAAGDLWAGTEEGGVVRRHQGRFVSYGAAQGLSSTPVEWIASGADGRPVILLYNSRVLQWSGEKFTEVCHQRGSDSGQIAGEVK